MNSADLVARLRAAGNPLHVLASDALIAGFADYVLNLAGGDGNPASLDGYVFSTADPRTTAKCESAADE
jgi:hypothetical protein